MMRPFGKRKEVLNLILSKTLFTGKKGRVAFYNRYVLPFFFLNFILYFLIYKNTAYNSETIVPSVTAITSLFFSFFLLLKLSVAERKTTVAESKSEVDRARFNNIYNCGMIGLWITNMDGVVSQANDTFLDMIGYSQSDLEKGLINWRELTAPGYEEVTERAIQQLKTVGTSQPFEKEYICKDGRRITVMLGSAMLQYGDAHEIVAYTLDITTAKAAVKREAALNEQVLQQQEEMMRVFMSAPASILIRKGPDLKLTFANNQALAQMSLQDPSIIGKTMEESLAQMNTSFSPDIFKQVYQTGKPFSGKSFHIKHDRQGTGEQIDTWYDFVLEPIFNLEGEVDGVVTFSFEVTDLVRANQEQKCAQEALKASEEHFKALANTNSLLIWQTNQHCQMTYVNDTWLAYAGINAEQVGEHTWIENVHPEDRSRAEQQFNEAFEKQEIVHSKYRFKDCRTGEYRWMLDNAHPVFNPNFKGYIGSMTDIHEQELAQISTNMLMQKKDEFLGIASHELKTPITSMKASFQVLKNGFKDESKEVKTLVPIIELANRQVNKLAHIVDDLLDVTKIQSGKMRLNKTTYYFGESLHDCLQEIRHQSPKHMLFTENEVPVLIYADRTRIEQVIINLLSNAVKYSPKKEPVRISVKKENNEVLFSVTDSGIGIPADKQSFIFDRFFRVHESSKLFSGLGLGLFISAEIVKQHQGSIGMKSTEGKGSVFWFKLPLNYTGV
jgi:two-component system CheB/CheR fusion protein